MTDIDRAGRPLDQRPLESIPRLVQERTSEREHADAGGRSELRSRRATVATGDTDQIDIGSIDQSAGDFEGRRRGTSGNAVPALLEGVGNAQRLGHRSIMPKCAT